MKSGSIDKAVFLDFDGVLFDTVKEAYCIAMLSSGREKSIDGINFDSKHYREFRNHRFLITRASDYYHLLKAMEKGMNIEDEYKASLGSDTENEKAFNRRYFAERDLIKSRNRDFWLSLNIPYDFLYKIKGIIGRRPEAFFIITTKDRGTVDLLLKIQNVEFREDNIFDICATERFKSKREAMLFVHGRYAIKKSVYVDDSEYHLSQVSGITGMDTIHAGWGYTALSEKAASESEALAKIEKFLGG